MKKWVFGTIVLVLAVGAIYIFVGRETTSATENRSQAAPTAAAVQTDSSVITVAKVVPVNSVELRFPLGGTIAAVPIKEGDRVAKGALLAQLDTRGLELRVAQAQAALDRARADRDRLAEGATPEEIAAAKAQVERSQAQLRQVQGDVTSSDIAAAKARLDQARANLQRLLAGPKTTEQRAAQADLDRANADLQSVRDSLSAAKTRAQDDMEKAANGLRNSQDAYNRVYWANRQAEAQLGPGQQLLQEQKDQLAAAQRTVDDAQATLAQAQVSYEEARQKEIAGVAAAEANVRNAQARLDNLIPDTAEVAAARAEVAQAEATLAKLRGDQRGGSLAAAQAGIASAQADLDHLTAAPRASALAAAEANAAGAEVELKQAQLALEQAALTSPIDGTVAVIDLKVGEAADPSLVAVVVADLTTWKIETTDLTELSIARVKEGAPVKIKIDALPGVELAGKVLRIKQRGENRQGDIVYTVIITPDKPDARLRWNMTASVTISGD